MKTQVQLFTANATAETYRKNVLVTKLTGRKEMEDAFGVYYHDEYVPENARWLIAKRRSVFDWEDKRELGQ